MDDLLLIISDILDIAALPREKRWRLIVGGIMVVLIAVIIGVAVRFYLY